MKVRSYQILESDSPKGISARVNEAIEQGWEPLGGVAVTRDDYESHGSSLTAWSYSQAMVKYDNA